MVQAQLKQLDQLREVNKRYHTHTVELKDKIAELIVSTHFDAMMMHKNTITSYYFDLNVKVLTKVAIQNSLQCLQICGVA